MKNIFFAFPLMILIMTSCSDLKKESKQELDELYLITLVLEHNGKEYEKEAFPLQSDCKKAFKNAERQFLNTPIKIKSIKCISTKDVKFDREKYKDYLPSK